MQSIDYNALWRQRRQASRACRGGKGNPYESPAQAEQYDRSRSIRQDGERRAAALPVSAGETVLDIGAGPGTLALPLARRGVAVTAVEPSPAMAALLRRHAQEEGLTHIRIIESTWEALDETQVGAHDLVVASYSLNMDDLRTALLRMDRAARRWVYLYWFAGLASWERLLCDLWPAVHGGAYIDQPKCDILYNLLYQEGIYPDLQVLEGTAFAHLYPDTQAALCNLRGRLGVADERFDPLFLSYLREHFRPEGDAWRFVDETRYVQLRWRPTGATA